MKDGIVMMAFFGTVSHGAEFLGELLITLGNTFNFFESWGNMEAITSHGGQL